METDIKRSAMVDMAKGIGIILVVYGHCLRGLSSAGFIPQDSPLLVTDYIVYTFHMPLFFIASGLFFSKSLQKSNRNFWIRQIKNILYPYFFWSLFCGSIQIILSSSSVTNGGMSLSRLSQILWSPISPFWFLYALFFCYFISWFLKNIPIVIKTTIFCILFIISFYTIGGVINDVFYGLLYFSIGIFIQKHKFIRLIPENFGAVLGVSTIFIITAFASYYLGVPERMPFIAAIMGVISTASICRFIEYKLGNGIMVRMLSALGQYSISIYVMHIIFIVFVRTILVKIFMIKSIPAVIIPAVLCGIFFPILIQRILIKFNINNLFGLPFSVLKENGNSTNQKYINVTIRNFEN
ncbi:acyltransferase family protein (plasmid) [Sphingomonas pseudosanguinis]|uniref:acyltransferase family protein n=1 Tax=Sphingomonas pseudosanguinis TaxID=413712 RepID=UPI003F85CA3F